MNHAQHDKDLRDLIILGDAAFAQVAHEYFTHDSSYRVVAFSVEEAYVKHATCCGLPVVSFETLEQHFAPERHAFFAAITYGQLNRLRARLYQAAKAKGYAPASYISSRAFVWPNASLGEHCFIFEHNVVQPFVTLGANVVLWSGNHIGHHSRVGDHCFIASHAVLSGYVDVGAHSFIGVNATIANNLTIGADCVIGAGALVNESVADDKVVRGAASAATGSAKRLLRVKP